MRRLALAVWLAAAFSAQAAPLDLDTSEAFNATCARLTPHSLVPATDDERIAAAVCRDVGLMRQLATWITQGMKRMGQQHPSEAVIVAEFEKEIDVVRSALAENRALLEKVKLGKRTSIRLVPAQWQLDLNGDGKVELWEQNFFAIPRRGPGPARFGMPSSDPAYYATAYNLDAAIRVDQSDVLWALAYHNFAEGLLTTLRAFDVEPKTMKMTVARPALLKQGHQRIEKGLQLSEQMRRAVLAETDDNEEWIGNPKQASSVFPLPLDAGDFERWGALLKEIDAVWQGRHLLPATRGHAGLLGEAAPLCEPGTGVNVRAMFYLTPAGFEPMPHDGPPRLPKGVCQPESAKSPMSNLPDMLEQAGRTDPGMQFLRYLYWTN